MKEVGRLTFREWRQQYDHYKNHYDFTVRGVTYEQLEEAQAAEDEWIPDK